ncbi:MAG TPA: LysR substrate-binding domain-containing protein [Candidatus Saccharimonadales bacterium]|nr:LysR substrate-binding domain-containing protein [Candidatus Saccharimonadales bacterium]
MEKHYSQLVIFYYVVDFMSFTKAAKYLNCSKAHASKQITELETLVGSPLLHRNTRAIKLTFAGEALFKHAQSIVHEIQFVENTVQSLQKKAQGILRITSPNGYADYLLAPNLSRFLNQYPDISLEMKHCGDLLDLVKEKIDVAIRITHEPPLDKVAKRLGFDRMVICASKKYLDMHGQPKIPQELHKHSCLVYSSERSVDCWPFYDEDKLVTIAVKSRVFSNSIAVLLNAALSGQGIARLPQFVVAEHIKNDELTVILPKYASPDTPVYAIFTQSRIIPPKIHAFIKFLEELHLVKF